MMLVTDTALLKSPSATGNALTVAVDDNKNFAENDFLIFGEVAKPKSERAQVSDTVALGTAIEMDTLTFPHNSGTPIYKIPYNQVKFYHAATLAGAKTLLGTVTIDVQNEFTTFTDTTNNTGFLFFKLYNSQSTDESDYSAGFDYGSISYGSRIKIREFVTSKTNYDKELDEETFNTLCDFAEAEIFAIRRWRFREKLDDFNTVGDQQSYSPTDTGITDLGQILYATYDGYPILPVNIKQHEYVNRNPNIISGTPRYIFEWNGDIYLSPTPSEVKEVEVFHYRNSSGFANETTESDVKLPQAIAFRVLQDLWAMSNQAKSQYWERRYLQTIEAMKKDDLKQVGKYQRITDSRLDNQTMRDQIENPLITI